MLNRRAVLAGLGAVASLATVGCDRGARSVAASTTAQGASQRLLLPPPSIEPSQEMRLSLQWSQARFKELQAKLGAAGYDGMLLTNQWNIVYFTGLWALTTERLLAAFVPAKGSSPIWFYPTLDKDLVRSWWYEDGEEYFDWHHVDGAFPSEGKLKKGPKVDLWRWTMDGLKRRGYGGKNLAVDKELVPSAQNVTTDVLGKPMASAGDICMNMRVIKTPEELALTRRAYSYIDRAQSFGRDLLLEKGSQITDFDLRQAMIDHITRVIVKDSDLDGPHKSVGISISLDWIRAGKVVSYPHPNQFRFQQLLPGLPLQMSGVLRIGGHGGECYRQIMIDPLNDQMKKLWTVNRDSCLLMKEELRAGALCSDVAYKIHDYQIKQGVQKYIYHRPSHGLGMEGHQPPYVALGDHTVLEPGMCLSVEPGLYDTDSGIGSNFSDMFVVQPEGPALQMSRVPWSEEWCWVRI